MCTITKDPSILIHCSDASKATGESIACLPVESSAMMHPIQMFWIYKNGSQASDEQFMPSARLQSTLANTLSHMPFLAGRLSKDANSNAIIHVNNAGALFTEARCPDHSLDYFLLRTPGDDDEEFDYENINAADLEVRVNSDWSGPVLSVQVTRLRCGSVIVAISVFHCLMDAQSAGDFMNLWAAGGQPKNHVPMLNKTFVELSDEERSRLEPICRPPECVFDRDFVRPAQGVWIEAAPTRVITRVYHFPASEVQNIKAAATRDLPSNVPFISSYDALYAHLILVIANATHTSFTDGANIKVLQSLNGRSRFVASHSAAVLRYFGSFAFWLYGSVPTDKPPTLSSLAQLIHDMHAKQTEASLKHYNAYQAGDIRKNQVPYDIINRDFHCASWRKVNMLGACFGDDNYPVFSGPTTQRYPRYFAMLDTRLKDESVNIVLGLREPDYQRMLEQGLMHKYR